MIDRDFLEFLVRMLDESSLDNMEIKRGGTRIRLSKSPGFGASPAGPVSSPPAPTQASVGSTQQSSAQVADGGESAPSSARLLDVTSPMVGTFYRAPSPDADPYVDVGTSVAEGDVLCVIEAMKLMNELECESAGHIVEVCVENAEPVDFGQVLFRIAPA